MLQKSFLSPIFLANMLAGNLKQFAAFICPFICLCMIFYTQTFELEYLHVCGYDHSSPDTETGDH